jgi:general secretion pathway protein K
LVVVMWALVLLGTIAMAVVAAHRTESALSNNLLNSIEGRAVGEAGIYYAIAKVIEFQGPDVEQWGADAGPRYWSFAGRDVRITVAGESGRIDLNAAPPELLLRLLEVVGVVGPEAEALVDAIQDWRDADSDIHLNGAEDPEYEAAGRLYGARDGNFSSVQELRQVLGMTSELYNALAPALTVYSARSKVNPKFAPRLVLAAILEAEEAELDLYLESRAETQPQGAESPLPGSETSPYVQQVRDNVYRIRADTLSGDARGYSVQAVVRVIGRDYQILAWEPVELASPADRAGAPQ